MTKPSKARRGRPPRAKDDQTVRISLLEAAHQCLSEKPSKSITIREIAERAGSTSAMIRYYFDNKEGLFVALVEYAVEHLAFDPSHMQTLSPPERSRALITLFLTQHRTQPWLPRLIADEVLSSDNSIRQQFVKGPGAKATKIMQSYITLQQEDGYFRADLDIKQASVSLLSLLAFPFISAPVTKLTHDFDILTVDLDEWIEHTLRIFEGGCR